MIFWSKAHFGVCILRVPPSSFFSLCFPTLGNGNVTKGALEIFHELPHEFVDPSELPEVVRRGDRNVLYGVMIGRSHC